MTLLMQLLDYFIVDISFIVTILLNNYYDMMANHQLWYQHVMMKSPHHSTVNGSEKQLKLLKVNGYSIAQS